MARSIWLKFPVPCEFPLCEAGKESEHPSEFTGVAEHQGFDWAIMENKIKIGEEAVNGEVII